MKRDIIETLLSLGASEIAVLVCGIVLRFLATSAGHNYDFDSFVLAAGIFDEGGNVYALTNRYNYGPIWFNLIGILFQAASRNVLIFRYLLVSILTLVDLLIYFILRQKFDSKAASLFFLNPISIMISGYHNQFDNVALLIGMSAILIIGDEFEKPINSKKIVGLILLGLSLVTKHILFAFPFWLAAKQKGVWQKVTMTLIPMFVFVMSFLPYWAEGKQGIIENVFRYNSFGNAYFYRFFVPPVLQAAFTSKMAWIILLLIFAMIFRHVNNFNSLLLYTCILIIASPAIANQYLVIALPYVAANLNAFTLSYTLIGTIFLLIDPNGLHVIDTSSFLTGDYSVVLYPILLFMLLFGFIQNCWSQQVRTFLHKLFREARIQLGYEQ